jgi:hypothetical protein
MGWAFSADGDTCFGCNLAYLRRILNVPKRGIAETREQLRFRQRIRTGCGTHHVWNPIPMDWLVCRRNLTGQCHYYFLFSFFPVSRF